MHLLVNEGLWCMKFISRLSDISVYSRSTQCRLANKLGRGSSLQTTRQRILRVISKETLDNEGGDSKGQHNLALCGVCIEEFHNKWSYKNERRTKHDGMHMNVNWQENVCVGYFFYFNTYIVHTGPARQQHLNTDYIYSHNTDWLHENCSNKIILAHCVVNRTI